jgi:REP element-mobilizing transposase RayT
MASHGAVFHIRLRTARDNTLALTERDTAQALLVSARYYHDKQRWWCILFLLMPDHIHALLSFPRDRSMSRVIGDWKRYTAGMPGVSWQANYFDHRIRHPAELTETYAYILRNSVMKHLCGEESDWQCVWKPPS